MSEPFEPNRSIDPVSAPMAVRESRLLDPVDEPSSTMSAFLPILIMGLALIAWFVFQATQLRIERGAMQTVIANQEKQVQDSKKLRDSLDAIARGTAQLADGGNANAKLIVDELKKRGITISPNQPTQGMDAAPAPAK